MQMRDALRYVSDTGYVPWATPAERACVEEMQARDLIFFVPGAHAMFIESHEQTPSIATGKTRVRRAARRSRYRLTAEGRRILYPELYTADAL